MLAILKPKLEIGWMQPRDLLDMCRIEREVFPFPWRAEDFCDRYYLKQTARDRKGRVIGYIVYRAAGRFIDLANMAVDPVYQRRGIATRMVKGLLETKAVSAVVWERNPDAIKFFRAIGFRAVGVERGAFGSHGDGYRFEKDS